MLEISCFNLAVNRQLDRFNREIEGVKDVNLRLVILHVRIADIQAARRNNAAAIGGGVDVAVVIVPGKNDASGGASVQQFLGKHSNARNRAGGIVGEGQLMRNPRVHPVCLHIVAQGAIFRFLAKRVGNHANTLISVKHREFVENGSNAGAFQQIETVVRQVVVATKRVDIARRPLKFSQDKVNRLGCDAAGVKQVPENPNCFNTLLAGNLPHGLDVLALGFHPIFVGTAPGAGATNMPVGCDTYFHMTIIYGG